MAKIGFAGTTSFGLPALEYLKTAFDLALIVTQPDKPAGRRRIPARPAVKDWAIRNSLDVIQPERIEADLDLIRRAQLDVLVVAAYGQIIPKTVLDAPKRGCVNLHASLLPKYRGASPIQAAILNGEQETGVTVMLMDEQLDHGPVLSCASVPIEDSDDYPALHERLSRLSASLLAETLPGYLDGSIAPAEQDHARATYAKKLKLEDARLDWTSPAGLVLRKIRAMNPEPGAWTTLDKKSVKILKASPVKTGRIELPGKIYTQDKDCLVKCGDYSLKLETVKPDGKQAMSGLDWLNGLKNLETKVFV